MALRKRCAEPDCTLISYTTRCPAHTKLRNRVKNGRRNHTARLARRRHLNQLGGGSCYLCRNYFPAHALQDDHIVALVDGGSEAASNRAWVCKPCHVSKTTTENRKRRR